MQRIISKIVSHLRSRDAGTRSRHLQAGRLLCALLLLLSVLANREAWAQADFIIRASDPKNSDGFGYSVSISGDYAIVGASRFDAGGIEPGAAYIFERQGAFWSEVAKLADSTSETKDLFGRSVSISGDYAIIGAPWNNTGGDDAGAAYIFENQGTTWQQRAMLTAPDAEAGDNFGWSVSISGDYAIVGAYLEEEEGKRDKGAAYIFKRENATWQFTDSLRASVRDNDDYFGWSVSISGERVIVGAKFNDEIAADAGAAYIFEREGETWQQVEKLTDPDGQAFDEFGYSVSIDSTFAIVGARKNNLGGNDDAGVAFVYERTSEAWQQPVKLTASDGEADDRFGTSVSISGDRILVGAARDDDQGMGIDAGSTYLFENTGSIWEEVAKLTASDGAAGNWFGQWVSISGERAIVGAPRNTNNDKFWAGEAYLYAFTDSAFTDINAGLAGVLNSSVAWGDYDNDGDLDILLSGWNSSIPFAEVYRNDGGNFTDIDAGLEGVRDGSVAWGDYDNDGDLDILLTGGMAPSPFGPLAKIYRNDEGTFVDINAGLEGVKKSTVAWGDYDNDGDLDILLTGLAQSGRISKVYRNDGSSFTDVSVGLPGVESGSVSWGDYDNDGDLDILLTGLDSSEGRLSEIYQNDEGSFVDINAGLDDVFESTVAWGDYDNDGDLDILLTGFAQSGRISKVYGNDAGSFTDINAGLAGASGGSAAWGDYDNDGDLDILLTGSTGIERITKVYSNDGNSFTEIGAGLPAVAGFGSVAWGDYDLDDDLDVLLTGERPSSAPISGVYRNESQMSNTPPSAPTGLGVSVTGSAATLSWDTAASGTTPPTGLTYNLRVGTTPGGSDVVAPMASDNGFRRIPARGNVNHNTSWTLENLSESTYYWSVQAVDHGFAGSAFAQEQSFVVVPPTGFVVNVDSDAEDLGVGDGTCATAAGVCTLRAAIQEANATAGQDVITFDIPGDGPHTILPGSALPTITESVTINGYSQSGAAENTDSDGFNGTLMIVLDGSNAGTGIVNGLHITGANSTIRGLVINNFANAGISLDESGSTNNTIEGNFLGTDATGMVANSTGSGVLIVSGASDNLIGGTTPEARNVISGNAVGVSITGGPRNRVEGNFIGTDASGMAPLANGFDGIGIQGAPSNNNVIGGTVAGARNVISGNTISGVHIFMDATNNRVEGNSIGLNVTGTGVVANGNGVLINVSARGNTIGGTVLGARNNISGNNIGVRLENNTTMDNRILGNTIAFNGLSGVALDADAGAGNAILNNNMFENGGLGIDLCKEAPCPDGTTPNDANDVDGGPNKLQNYPSIIDGTAVINNDGDLIVSYLINSDPVNSTYPLTIEFFAAAEGEGRALILRDMLTEAQYSGCGSPPCEKTAVNLGVPEEAPDAIVATATDRDGNTSEFSPQTSVTNQCTDTTPPGAPSGLSAVAGDGQITLQWTPNDEPDLHRYIIYRGTSPQATTLIAISGKGTEAFIDTGLNNGTRYYYRLKAKDTCQNESDYSNEVDAIPVAVDLPPDIPSGLTAVAGDAQVTLTWSPNDDTDLLRYRIYRGTSPAPIIPVDSVDAGTEMFPDMGVVNGTTYYYRLTAVDDSLNESGYSNEESATPVAVDLPPNPPSGLSAVAGDAQITLSWSPNDETDLQGYRIYRGTSSPSTTLVGNVETGTETFLDTGLVNRTIYFYHITAVDTAGNESVNSNEVSALVRPTRITVEQTLSFPDTTQANYRMVGIPGNGSIALTTTFSGQTRGTEWRAFRDTGGEDANYPDYLAECTASTCTFTPGVGFWVLSQTEWNVTSQQVDAVALDEADYSATIALQSGWNIISNPFDADVSWEAVKALNRSRNGDQDLQPLWDFQGNSSMSSTLRPYQGYYFLNRDDTLPDLKIPYPSLNGAASKTEEVVSVVIEPLLHLSVYGKGGAVSTAEVGIWPEAKAGLDGYDYVAPPGAFEAVKLSLVRQELPVRYQWLAREIRPELGEGQVFELVLQATPGEAVTLQVEGLEQFEGSEVYLVDRRLGKPYDLRAHPALQLLPEQERTAYQLLIGGAGFIEEAQAQSVPEDFRLLANYPNPFNPSTVIEYALPASVSGEEVRLEVYNVVGQRVRVLVAGRQEAGFYRVEWDGRDQAGVQVASGVYLYRLRVGDFSQVRRMLLLK